MRSPLERNAWQLSPKHLFLNRPEYDSYPSENRLTLLTISCGGFEVGKATVPAEPSKLANLSLQGWGLTDLPLRATHRKA